MGDDVTGGDALLGQGGAGTAQTGTWRDQLPADLRGHEAFAEVPGLGDLAKTHLSLREKVTNSIPKLSDKATDAEKEAFYLAIGRPEKPDGYEIKIPDGITPDDKLVNSFRAKAFELGIPKSAAENLAVWFAGEQMNTQQTVQRSAEEFKQKAINTLKDEWKGDYQKNLDDANKAVAGLVDDSTFKYLQDSGLANDPVMVKFFHHLSKVISEDIIVKGTLEPPPAMKRTEAGMPMLEFPSMKQ